MTDLATIAGHLDALLGTAAIPDYPGAVNGVQLANRGAIRRIAASVDISKRVIDGAIAAGANLLIVHHGMFWGGAQPIIGPAYDRIRMLVTHDIAVYSSHLPLDAHPSLGNNVLLAHTLGLEPAGGFARYKTIDVGVRGETDLETTELCNRAEALARRHGGGVRATTIPPGHRTRRWGICTGAGASTETLLEAQALALDTLVVGEGPHHTAVAADEAGLVVIYAGHYATETLGVSAVAEHLTATFGIPSTFIAAPDGFVTDATPVLALEGIGKRFDDVVALADASLVVRPGSVHALLGENGAGKTTLMRVAYGMVSPDRGALRIAGRTVRLTSPADAIGHGIGMVHQHFTLVPAMTVAENIALGGRGRFVASKVADQVRMLANATGLAIEPDARVRDLSVSAQQRLELLKALSRDAQLLILDEPTAVLAPAEAGDLLNRIRQLADGGRSVVLITHKLREAMQVADDITVLRRGTTTLAMPRAEIDDDGLITAMLGQRDYLSPTATKSSVTGPTVISARGVSVADASGTMRVREATFDVRGGEIVGVAAIEGAGHRELLRAVARRSRIVSGTLQIPPVIGFVPDDRLRDGLVLEMSLTENQALDGAGARRGTIRWDDAARITREILGRFDVRAPSEHVHAGALSGGNQQKFILGRELHGRPPAIVIENPTRGLDIRATAYVRQQVLEARSYGVAIVLYSMDLDEVLALADRMLVVFGGRVREVPVDGQLVGRAMLGAS